MNKRSDGIPCSELKGINVNLPIKLYKRLWVTSKVTNKSMNMIVTNLLEGFFNTQSNVSYDYLNDFDVDDIYDALRSEGGDSHGLQSNSMSCI